MTRGERAVDIADAVRAQQLRAVEAVSDALARIESLNATLNAFVHVDADAALRAAEEVDLRVLRGEDPGPLAGVPFGVKDVEDCRGMPTAQGSPLYAGTPVAADDSIAVARLRAAGAIPVGKTALGDDPSTHSHVRDAARNPWNPERSPSGSSGGSAAAVASGMVPLATASDTWGSIRGPAAFCGVVGMKPSLGRVPDAAVRAITCSGALVGCVEDAARHLDVVKGPDDRDWQSLPADPRSYERELERVQLAGWRAVWSELGYPRLDEETYALARAAANDLVAHAGLSLDQSGWTPPEPIAPTLSLAASAVDYWLMVDQRTWAQRRAELGEAAIRYVEDAAGWTVPTLTDAHRRRLAVARSVADLFRSHDFLLVPSSSVPAFAVEQSLENATFEGAPMPFGPDPQHHLANLCGNPAISVPAGITGDGLPVGLQIVGRRHHDLEVLALAHALAGVRPWPRHPPEFRG